jgi:riboflavin kinase/FMN adenylyltransferase
MAAMKVLDTTDLLEGRSCVTIGVFDGVHAGHQSLVRQLSDLSQGDQRVVVTFDQHPLCIVAPGYAPKMLTTLEQRLELLERTGNVDAVLVVPFNAVRAAQSARDFVQEVLVDQLHASHVLIGENFVFGHERKGNIGLLEVMGQEDDFDVTPVNLLANDSKLPVSSTRIRQYISVGDVAKAAELLTRPHRITGTVVGGDKVGTKLGYPTANTDVDQNMSIPSDGVYAGRVQLDDGSIYKSAISIGVRPMFHEDNIRVIEPFLLDFEGDIYGKQISIEFIERLRDQLVLDSVDDLVAQIDVDVEKVRETVTL